MTPRNLHNANIGTAAFVLMVLLAVPLALGFLIRGLARRLGR